MTTYHLSVVSVSDYEPGAEKTWNDEKALIIAIAEQDLAIPFEVILVESTKHRGQPVPSEFFDLIPDLKVHYCDSEQSATLKDYGVSVSNGTYIAVLESDCIPAKNWLRLLLEAVDAQEYDIVSGRTYYGEETAYQRVMNLMHRSWDDPGSSGSTEEISNNGAVYHREILEKYPYPDAVTPFISAAIRNKKIREGGHRFYFERTAKMKHAIGGAGFIWDYQRNKGHQCMSTVGSYKYSNAPKLIAQKFIREIWACKRLGNEYLNLYDWPLLPIIMLLEIVPFTVGMFDALRKVPSIPGSAYR